jgi:hypothetical protein
MKASLFAIAALCGVSQSIILLQKPKHPHMTRNVQFIDGLSDQETDALDFVHTESNWGILPTCTDSITTNCQPVCTESLTTGCTEARTPNAPYRDRYEGRRTFKGPEKTESPWST